MDNERQRAERETTRKTFQQLVDKWGSGIAESGNDRLVALYCQIVQALAALDQADAAEDAAEALWKIQSDMEQAG